MRIWRRRSSGLERDLRSLRPQPGDELVRSITANVRGRSGSTRLARFGVAIATAGLVAVAVASYGGLSYAAGSAVVQPRSSAAAQYGGAETTTTTATTTTTVTTSATTTTAPEVAPTTTGTTQTGTTQTGTTQTGTTQTGTTTGTTETGTMAGTTETTPTKTVAGGLGGTTPPTSGAQPVQAGTLPFTGLALWIPLAGGLMLVALGLGLRLQARRR